MRVQMEELSKIRRKISEIAERPDNVSLSEIERIVRQLEPHGFAIGFRNATHGKLIRVDQHRCLVCTHRPGSKQVKSCYVKAFLKIMVEIGLYEEL